MSDKPDPILAKPADLCCLKGSFHTGEPQGKTTHIEGIETYIAAPAPDAANDNILLYFPDAFGLHGNSYLLMDAFASCGYLTLGADYFLGVCLYGYGLGGRKVLIVVGCCVQAYYDAIERPEF